MHNNVQLERVHTAYTKSREHAQVGGRGGGVVSQIWSDGQPKRIRTTNLWNGPSKLINLLLFYISNTKN